MVAQLPVAHAGGSAVGQQNMRRASRRETHVEVGIDADDVVENLDRKLVERDGTRPRELAPADDLRVRAR